MGFRAFSVKLRKHTLDPNETLFLDPPNYNYPLIYPKYPPLRTIGAPGKGPFGGPGSAPETPGKDSPGTWTYFLEAVAMHGDSS